MKPADRTKIPTLERQRDEMIERLENAGCLVRKSSYHFKPKSDGSEVINIEITYWPPFMVE